MKLHEDKEAFTDLIEAAAQAIGLPQVYVEKDYWVTKALKSLSQSPYAKQAVFKGGTSLSKAHKLIHRFSEDIDLAVFSDGRSGNAIKNLLKSIESAASAELEAILDERITKGSLFRKSVYRYPRILMGGEFGQASPELLIEVNAFTQPEPYEKMNLQTLITDVLAEQGRVDLIEGFGLQAFPINVLSIRRTLVEKLLGVIKDSYHQDPIAQLSKRIRHLYDICLILNVDGIKDFVGSDDCIQLLNICIADEKKGDMGRAEFLAHPLTNAPLFSQFEYWKPALLETYNGVFSQLVYGQLPEIDSIHESLIFIQDKLVDQKH